MGSTRKGCFLAAISAAIFLGCGGQEQTAPVADTKTVEAVTYQITVNPGSAQIVEGKSLRLTATVVGSNGKTVSAPVVAFASSDESVATVSADSSNPGSAVVSAIKTGTATVTVTYPSGAGGSGVASSTSNITVVSSGQSTYSMVFPSQALDLQYGKPASIAATVLDGAGNDVTAQATSWTWVASNPGMVAVTGQGNKVTAQASNPDQLVNVSYITGKAVAPDGSSLTAHVAAIAVPSYTYQMKLSATTVKAAFDIRPKVTATVMRSDGQDVTDQFGHWNWELPRVPVGATLPADTAPGAMLLFPSGYGNVATFGFNILRSDPGLYAMVPVTVSALGPNASMTVASATVQVATYAMWTTRTDVGALDFSGVNPLRSLAVHFFHNSVEETTEVASPCQAITWSANVGSADVVADPLDSRRATATYVPGNDWLGSHRDTATMSCMIDAVSWIYVNTPLTF